MPIFCLKYRKNTPHKKRGLRKRGFVDSRQKCYLLFFYVVLPCFEGCCVSLSCGGVSASPKPHPSKTHPCSMPQAKTEVALQFSECCAAEVALQHSLFCSADVILTKSCAAASELHCNIAKAALQESGVSCRFPADFKLPRLGTHV